MVVTTFIDNAKVMANGQVTIPKDIREILGVSSGDRITFVVENGSVRVVNADVTGTYGWRSGDCRYRIG